MLFSSAFFTQHGSSAINLWSHSDQYSSFCLMLFYDVDLEEFVNLSFNLLAFLF